MLSLSSLVLSSPLGIVDPCSPRCSPGEQCENGICVKSCPAGSVLVDGPSGTLICKLALNSKCGRTEDCAESKLMNCDTSPTGQFRCKSKPGGFCFDQTDCSIMITGKPLCSENFCKRVLNLGDTGCSSDSTKKICDKGLKCVGDTCRSPIDGPCEKTSNCDPTSGKSTCEFNVCKSLPGGPCSSDSQCEKSWDTLNPSKCVDGTCKATLNFLNTGCSDSNYVCGLGLKCFNDTCLSTLKLGNTGCSDSNKICDIGLKCFENKCISTLNGYCSQTSDCDQTSGASNCDKNVCKLLPGGLCSNDSQCDKSRYPSNTCNTNSGFCMSSCTSNSDCYAPPNSKYSALCLSSKFCRIIPTEYNCKTFLG